MQSQGPSENTAVKMCKEPVLEGLEFDGDTVLCRVCGDKASGFHYGVHACEGCKGFFRRSIQQKIQYRPCLKNQQCNIMRVNRNRCQYCRLKKCIAVGMSRDAVRFGRVPKKEKAKIMEQMQKVNNQSQSNILNSILEMEVDIAHKVIEAHLSTCDFTRVKFKTFMERSWQNPEFVNCPAHMACPLNPNPSVSEGNKRWEEFSECFTPAIRNVVNFAKCIPGFQVLGQEDQVTLLKAGTFEVLLVHLACLFDSQSNTMLFTNGKLYKRVSLSVTNSAGFLLDSMFDFAERLNALNLTEDEVGLFSAIVIIASDRPGLRSVEQVEKIQSRITQALQAVMAHNHPEDPAIFAKLLMKIPDLRTLNTLHSEKLLGLSVPAASRPQNDKLKTSSENQPPPAYFQSGMLPPGFPPIYSSHMIPGHPTDGEPSFHSRPPDLPTLPLPLEPPGHPGGMLLHSSYGAFPRFSSAILNLPSDPEYEVAGRKHLRTDSDTFDNNGSSNASRHDGKDVGFTLTAAAAANQKSAASSVDFDASRVISNAVSNTLAANSKNNSHMNGDAPSPAIWSPAALHLARSQDKTSSDPDRQPNVITEPLYPAENQRKRSSMENLSEADSKMARMWKDKAPSGKCPFPGGELGRPGFPFLHHSLSPYTADKHHRSASESEAMQHPVRQEPNHHTRMKSLSESEALTSGQGQGYCQNGLDRLVGSRPGQDHPVLKTALNTPPLSMRRDLERCNEGLTRRELTRESQRSEENRKSVDSRKSVESRKSDDSISIDILETHSEAGSKCSSPASNVSEPYLLHKKLKMKRRTSTEGGSDRSSPDGSTEGFTRREEVEGLENKMAELSRPSWEPPLLITPPSESRENHSPPRHSPMSEDPKLSESRLNGVTSLPVTSGFNLSAAVSSHPAYLPHPQFTTLHPALLYQYNTYAMQHQLAHIQHMQLAQLQMSHQKQKRPELRNEVTGCGEEGVIKDSNQNSITAKTTSPLNLTTKSMTNCFSAERLISVKDEPM